ncbi:MAG: 3-hydroxyacyl-CoA dehydrogenase NAD-binding domain-containing protein [Balneolaceae bacterium]
MNRRDDTDTTKTGSTRETPSLFRLEREGNVAVIILDDPDDKVNKLNREVMDQFASLLQEVQSDNTVRGAVLISGKESSFIAGADLGMIQAASNREELEELSRTGQKLLKKVEESPKPIVAAIHGSCMGGGTELALACRYRVVSDHPDTKIALPEVKLGLLPGTGGTQRLPRLIGIQRALGYMLTGKNMYSRQARKTGFADEMVDRTMIERAGVEAVRRLANSKPERKDRRSLFEKLLESNAPGRAILFSQARKRTARQAHGNYPAPPRIIDSVEYGYKHGKEKGLENESVLFGELASTPESKALVQLFFDMNRSKKNPFKEHATSVSTVAVLGAGLMGSGIADVSIQGGMHVWLKDRTLDDAEKGRSRIEKRLAGDAEKGLLTKVEKESLYSRIHITDSWDPLQRTELVIEAVFEDLELKQKILADVEAHTGSETIFASNTSSLPITDISKEAKRPENVLGMHYFSPVQKMPLLEIVRTEKTSTKALATAYETGIRQGKNVIVVQDGPGFYTTRILAPYMNEMLLLLEEGAAVEDLDGAMKAFGFPVGPVALLDEVGIDVGAHVAGVVGELFRERGAETSAKADELVENDYLGRKNGQGFYLYNGDKGKKSNKEVNTDIYRFFGGEDRKAIDREEIQQRLSMVMVNEAVYTLQEGILQSPTDGDLGAILGLGFPPFTGGPFRWIDRIGSCEFSDRMARWQDKGGARFNPAPLLEEKAKRDEPFHSGRSL